MPNHCSDPWSSFWDRRLGNYQAKEDSLQDWRASTGELVRFHRKHSKVGALLGTDVYEEWMAPSAQAAIEYLNTRTISVRGYYLVVDTPEGSWGKDALGDYREPATEQQLHQQKLPDFKVSIGVGIDAKDENGETALYRGANTGDSSEVKRLLNLGASVHTTKSNGWTPLHRAACSGHIEVAEALLAAGANLNAKCRDSWTPLHQAVRNRKTDVVKILLDHGADANVQEKYGDTPLHIASISNQLPVVLLLIAKGANATLRNSDGRNALEAAEIHYEEVSAEIKQALRGHSSSR